MNNEIAIRLSELLASLNVQNKDILSVVSSANKALSENPETLQTVLAAVYEFEKSLFDEIGEEKEQIKQEPKQQKLPKEGQKIKRNDGTTLFQFNGLFYIAEPGDPGCNNCDCVFKKSSLCTEKMDIFGSCRENHWKTIHEYRNN